MARNPRKVDGGGGGGSRSVDAEVRNAAADDDDSDDDNSAQDVGAAAESGTQTVVNMRGKRIDSVVAAQGSHSEGTGRIADCAL